MQKKLCVTIAGTLLVMAGYLTGSKAATAAETYAPMHGTVPKSYGRLATVIADSIGTGLIFEDSDGVIRFVSVTGMKEGELKRY